MVLRRPLRGGEGEGKGRKGKGGEEKEKGGEGKGREVDSDAQLEQGRRLAKAGPGPRSDGVLPSPPQRFG